MIIAEAHMRKSVVDAAPTDLIGDWYAAQMRKGIVKGGDTSCIECQGNWVILWIERPESPDVAVA